MTPLSHSVLRSDNGGFRDDVILGRQRAYQAASRRRDAAAPHYQPPPYRRIECLPLHLFQFLHQRPNRAAKGDA